MPEWIYVVRRTGNLVTAVKTDKIILVNDMGDHCTITLSGGDLAVVETYEEVLNMLESKMGNKQFEVVTTSGCEDIDHGDFVKDEIVHYMIVFDRASDKYRLLNVDLGTIMATTYATVQEIFSAHPDREILDSLTMTWRRR